MDSLYLILLALFLLVIIPRIMQRRRLAAIKHILNQKMQNKENCVMKEWAKRFFGEECIIYTITSNDGWRLSIWISSPVFDSIRERRTERKRTLCWTEHLAIAAIMMSLRKRGKDK